MNRATNESSGQTSMQVYFYTEKPELHGTQETARNCWLTRNQFPAFYNGLYAGLHHFDLNIKGINKVTVTLVVLIMQLAPWIYHPILWLLLGKSQHASAWLNWVLFVMGSFHNFGPDFLFVEASSERKFCSPVGFIAIAPSSAMSGALCPISG